ncbi:hypothetical protein T492DRAFT_1109462 [Pavlovales sp. CCMP2436]|nr:hypothetical protein T492DRAFT_1109462 [Pavlovales sp. CCMP2436]|mmetsp:Transcript_48885/g.112145  ORF Transcript_48885/g.112145 Transcript_48885/m.112145 type:complete len:155 (-) Transcript_48885:128-592(-)
MRAAGNERFAAGDMDGAAECYREAEEALRFVPPNASVGSERSALLLAVWLNLSLVMLRLRRWREVVEYTGQVLAREPGSVKALFRRASALLEGLQEFDEAERDVSAGLTLEPANGDLRRLKRSIAQARASERRRESARYSRMFGGPEPPVVEPP